jgi:zinc transport system substrate-binding protein
MKIYLYFLLTLLLAACGSKQQTEGEKPVITVSIEPLRYFTEAIAGDRFRVISLVPEGSSPETYDPTPQQLVDLNQSCAFLRAGYIGYELIWADKLHENAPNVPFFNLSEGVNLIHESEKEGHKHAGGIEPHTWNSVRNAYTIAANICQALCQIDPEHKEEYMTRFTQFGTVLKQTDEKILTYLNGGETIFLIYHPALSYFARDYGLTQISIEKGGKEPSPAQLKALINQCHEQHVQVIFVQKEFDTRNAEMIAQELNIPIVTVNPLSYRWEEEMLHIARALSKPSKQP